MRTLLLFALTLGAAAALADDAFAFGKRGRKSGGSSSCSSCGSSGYAAAPGGCSSGVAFGAMPAGYNLGQAGAYSPVQQAGYNPGAYPGAQGVYPATYPGAYGYPGSPAVMPAAYPQGNATPGRMFRR